MERTYWRLYTHQDNFSCRAVIESMFQIRTICFHIWRKLYSVIIFRTDLWRRIGEATATSVLVCFTRLFTNVWTKLV